MQRFPGCAFERTLGVQKMHQIEISYIGKNDVESTIHKLKRITQERKYSFNS